MKQIPLTKGKFALVDDADYDYLSQWKWYSTFSKKKWYVFKSPNQLCNIRKMHSLLLGSKEGLVIDHINGDGLDNRRENLRFCTQSQNCQNRKHREEGTSKYKGVSIDTSSYVRKKTGNIVKYWFATIKANGKNLRLKRFPFTPEGEIEAAKLYDEAAKKYFGEFAYLNFK